MKKTLLILSTVLICLAFATSCDNTPPPIPEPDYSNYTLKPGSDWFDNFEVDRNTITEIHFVTTKPAEITSDPIIVNLTDSADGVVGYLHELTKVYIVGEKIYANPDSSNMFWCSDHNYDEDKFTAVATLELGNLDTSNVTNMGDMFGWMASLTSLDLSNFNTSHVTDMNNMFTSCLALTTLDLSSFDTSNVTTMMCMFSRCFNLGSVNVSSFNTSNVEVMAAMFSDCYSITPLDVSNFDTGKVWTMLNMFADCRSLVTLDLSSFDLSSCHVIDDIFNNSNMLNTVIISPEMKSSWDSEFPGHEWTYSAGTYSKI